MREEQLSNLDRALVDILERSDELERINQDLKTVRKMLLIFASSVVVWSGAITALLHIIRQEHQYNKSMHWKIEKGDEVIVNGELLYVEKKAKKKWYKLLAKDYWHCYNGYGEDQLVARDQMVHKKP